MKDIGLHSIIKKVLLEEVYPYVIGDDKAFTKREVIFFKFINEYKESANPTSQQINKFIQILAHMISYCIIYFPSLFFFTSGINFSKTKT